MEFTKTVVIELHLQIKNLNQTYCWIRLNLVFKFWYIEVWLWKCFQFLLEWYKKFIGDIESEWLFPGSDLLVTGNFLHGLSVNGLISFRSKGRGLLFTSIIYKFYKRALTISLILKDNRSKINLITFRFLVDLFYVFGFFISFRRWFTFVILHFYRKKRSPQVLWKVFIIKNYIVKTPLLFLGH